LLRRRFGWTPAALACWCPALALGAALTWHALAGQPHPGGPPNDAPQVALAPQPAVHKEAERPKPTVRDRIPPVVPQPEAEKPNSVGPAGLANPTQDKLGRAEGMEKPPAGGEGEKAPKDAPPPKRPSRYQPPKFEGRVGEVFIRNTLPFSVTFTLWHPASGEVQDSWKVESGKSVTVPLGIGDDWGAQINDSAVKPLSRCATWNAAKRRFEVSVASLHGKQPDEASRVHYMRAVELAGLTWTADLNAAVTEARKAGKLVFVSFACVACPLCKLDERTIFPQAKVKESLRPYVLARLFIDEVPKEFYDGAPTPERRRADAEANADLSQKLTGKRVVPLYLVLRPLPDGKTETVAICPEGGIGRLEPFLQFLARPPVGKSAIPPE
jgi:hypothetical protein